jgi:hypothetical protein
MERLGLASVCLGWEPKTFWASTIQEFIYCIEAYGKKNGIGNDQRITSNDALDIIGQVEANEANAKNGNT